MEFGHHPDAAVDFCLEVEAIENDLTDRAAGLQPQIADIGARIDRAMQFKVGGDTGAVVAKNSLRSIEQAFKAGASCGLTVPLAGGWGDLREGKDFERTSSVLASQPALRERIYIECCQCDDCQHIGINDAAATSAACTSCDWKGQSPTEDRCPGCGETGTMTRACPECGGRYRCVAEGNIDASGEPVPAGGMADAAWLLPDDMQALKRFYETSEDSQPYDVPKDRMRRLAELGAIQWNSGSRYSLTAFGQYVLDLLPEGWPRLPLKTHADHSAYTNAQIDASSGVAAVPEPDKGKAWAEWREHPQFAKAAAQTHFDAGWVRALGVKAGGPMPPERIAMLWNSLPLETDPESVVAFVRAVERFHGVARGVTGTP